MAKAAGIRVYAVSLGTPNGKVTFGFGAFMNSIPVPPDPTTMRQIAADDGRQGLHGPDASSVVARSTRRSARASAAAASARDHLVVRVAAAALLLVGAVATGALLDGRLP